MSEKLNPVVRLSELSLTPFTHGKNYASSDVGLGEQLALTHLGAGFSIVPPGKTSCPFHVHHGEDEMFIILEGTGEYRFGEETYEVRAGDVLGAPVGGAEYAHQLWNTGEEPLCYLSISSKADIDVCEYPDTGKFAVMSKGGKQGDTARDYRYIGRPDTTLDYFDGDKDV